MGECLAVEDSRMWARVELPEIPGPVAGFTFPRDDVVYVLTPDGLVRVTLTPAVDVRRVAAAIP